MKSDKDPNEKRKMPTYSDIIIMPNVANLFKK